MTIYMIMLALLLPILATPAFAQDQDNPACVELFEMLADCLGTAEAPSLQTSYELQRSTRHTDWRSFAPPGAAVAYGDFDGDGDEDVFASGISFDDNWKISLIPVPLRIYTNNGAGRFSQADWLFDGEIPKAVHPRKALTNDFNGDGRLDIFVAAQGYDAHPWPGEPPVLLLSTENGLRYVSDLPNLEGYRVGFHHAAASADIDLDGDLDIFVTDAFGSSFFLKNDGQGVFVYDTSPIPAGLRQGIGIYTAELIDVDDDAHPDLLVGGHEHEGMSTAIYWGDSSGTYSAERRTTLPTVDGQGVVLDFDAEDLDGDGLREIVVNRTGNDPFYAGYFLQIVTGIGGRQFTDETAQRIPTGADSAGHWINWVRLDDANNDGHLDILIDGPQNWDLSWLNDGAGHFTMAQ